jgi:dipeptidyl aminopeptidase/acylaminoacyl peptidase
MPPNSSKPVYDFQRYLNIRTATGATFSPKADKIAFLTDITGVYQVWCIDEPGRWPEQLTFYKDRVTFVKWSTTEDSLVFGKDAGGNEKDQIYLLTADGSIIVPLTEQPEAIHRFGGWSHDGQWIAYASNQRNKAFFDIYIQNVKTRETRCVYQGDGTYYAVAWSPDDKHLLLGIYNSNFDQDLYALELATQKVIPLTPHKGSVRYTSPAWAPDGREIYLITDKERDFLNLAYIDLTTQNLIYLEGTSWDVESVLISPLCKRGVGGISPNGRLMVYTTNVDGYSKLTIKELNSGKVLTSPELPPGIIDVSDISQNGDKVLLSYNSPCHNGDIWLYKPYTNELTQVTRSSRAGIPQDSFVEPKLIRYETFDGRDIPAFFYLPSPLSRHHKLVAPGRGRGKKTGETPVIVNIHGGPEAQALPTFSSVFQYFIHRGFALFIPNVRGSTGYGKKYSHLDDVRLRMNSVKDIAYGVEWLKSSGYIDSQKISVMGGSYGGFMTLASLVTYPDLWAAGVDLVGIANFLTFLKNTGAYRRHLRISEYGDPEKDADFLREISPINHVDKIKAPLLVIQGANDPRVPKSEADQIVEAIRKRNGIVEYLLFEDEGHGLAKLENRITAYTTIADFLDKYLKSDR